MVKGALSNNPLEELFERFRQHHEQQQKYEPLSPLSKREADEWEHIQTLLLKAVNLKQEAEAKRSLFWAKMERKTGIYDRILKVDNGMLQVQVREKNNCQHSGQAMPGFCDGNCADCSLDHDHELPQ